MKSTDKILAAIKDGVSIYLPKDGKAILYGSRARNDAREDSDWDILILLNKDKLMPEDYDKISYPIIQIGWQFNEIINPVMYTEAEWQKYSFTPFYHNVMKEGIRL